jgi:phage-related protein
MVEAVLSYVVKAIDESSSVMDKVRASVGLVGSAVGELGGGFTSVGNIMQGFAGAGVVGAVSAGLGEVIKGLEASVKQASDTEKIFTDLGAAVDRSGTAWKSVREGTITALEAMQRTTVYSKDEMAAALQRLMTYGLSYEEAMKALGSSLDFAAAKHMDLESAATLVGKALDGNTAIMKRYGVDIATSKDQAKALDDAQKALATSLKDLGADWGNIGEALTGVGVKLTDVNGKMRSTKDIAADLVDAFKQGNIDLPRFEELLTTLGIKFDDAKLKGGSATEVMAKLNEQFGGAAQAAAGTYAGTQERLNHACAEVSEKVGNILLPALTSITEAMIPVADQFGKGVDAVSAWLAEVGKMPEVQGFMAAVSDAFKGFWDYLQGLWAFIQESFGPAIKELLSAFKDLWDALSPIGDALKELLGAFGDTGNIDLLKTAIEFVVIQIRAVAFVIKEVSPYIKAFAQAFREAADFIAPVLKEIVDGIRFFVDALHRIFQDFYNWLVGKSLWIDLWNQVLIIAREIITKLLADIESKMFEPIKAGFQQLVSTVEDVWNRGWEAIRSTFITISNAIRDVWQTFLNAMTGAMGVFWTSIETATSTAFATLQGAFTAGMDALEGILNGAISAMQSAWSGFTSWLSSGISTAQSAVSSAAATVSSTISTMQGAASSAASSIQSTLSGAWNAITTGATDLWNALVGHSIWTDLMETMQAQTYSALGNIADAFGHMSVTIPSTLAYSPAATSTPAPSQALTPSAAEPGSFSFTIPITVTLDGQTISRQVETRIVRRANIRAKKVA